MKLVISFLICFILVSPGISGEPPSTGMYVATLAYEIVIVSGGISSVISNTLYLSSDYREKPSLTAGYIWASFNLVTGVLIWYLAGNSKDTGLIALGIGQTLLGVAGVATTIAVANKPLTYGTTVLFDSEKKPVVGLSIHLHL